VVRRPTAGTAWRGSLATRVWPWVTLAWALPALLSLLLLRLLGQRWLGWFLFAAWAVAPVVTWWLRGRGRAPDVGFYALAWLLILVTGWIEAIGVAVPDEVVRSAALLLIVVYWPSWAWFYKLRKLPSARIELADRFSISIFLATGPVGFATSIGGPEAAKRWDWLAVASFVTLLLTGAVVVIAAKGPAWVREQAKDARAWAVPWLRVYSKPSLILEVTLGYIAVTLAFEPLSPDWLSPWLGLIYLSAVVLLTRLLLRPSHQPNVRRSWREGGLEFDLQGGGEDVTDAERPAASSRSRPNPRRRRSLPARQSGAVADHHHQRNPATSQPRTG
jgi:hypothetical protein